MAGKKTLILIVIFVFSKIICQDIEYFEKLAVDGKMSELEKSLSIINDNYPDHPITQYINAALNNNGEEAFIQYNAIIFNFPSSIASELSIMKIGEYLYSKGFYSQAIEQLVKIPLFFPKSKNIERAVELLKKSYLATGQSDSLEFYINKFSEMYPMLNFSNYNFSFQDLLEQEVETNRKEDVRISNGKSQSNKEIFANEKNISWIVQVGAFSNKKNAETIYDRLLSAGYTTVIVESTGIKNLYLVQILELSSLEDAIIVGERIQNQFGLEFIIKKV